MKRFVLMLFCLILPMHAAMATEVQEVVTKGGFTAWLIEDHTLPLLAIRVSFRDSGYAYDALGKEGRATMSAAMLTEGAGDLSSRAFNEALESLALQFIVNTDEDMFNTSMESLSEHKQEAFSYLGMALTHARFDDEAIERTRRQTLSLIVQEQQQPSYQLQRTWLNLAYKDHPYSHMSLGLNDTVEKLQKQDLQSFASRYLTKENVIISVAGDITVSELSALLDSSLGDLPPHYQPDVTVPDVTIGEGQKPVIIDFTIPQSMVMFGAQGLKRDDPDYFPAYVMNQMLGGSGSLNSKLAVEIREKRGLAYSVASAINPMKHGASWQGEFATRNEKVGAAIATLQATLKDFIAKGPTDKELADAKQFLTGSFVLHLDSNAGLADFMTNMQMNHLGRDYLDKRNAMINAVTKQQVTDIARKLIHPDSLQLVIVGKPDMKAE